MDKTEAQEILRRYRPGTADADEPEVKEALQLAAGDPDLGQWLERQLAFAEQVRSAMRNAPVPADLEQAILKAEFRRRQEAFRRVNLVRYAIAASIVLLAGIWFFQSQQPVHNDFNTFRDRMVKTAPCRSVLLPAEIVPPMASMKPRQMERPRPVPARTWSPLRTR